MVIATRTDPRADSYVVRKLTSGNIANVVRHRYEDRFGNPPMKPGGWYHDDDWRRTTFVLDRLRPGAKILDVGAGAGQFANMAAASGMFSSVAALDHVRFEKYSEFSALITRYDASVAELPFDDHEFDVVTCMEVLEHVPEEVFLLGIAELRRVCCGQLVISVPFEEEKPLSKGHLRRFEERDVVRLFPTARYTVLERPRMPWMIIEERLDGSNFDDAPDAVAASRARKPRREHATGQVRSDTTAVSTSGTVIADLDWAQQRIVALEREVEQLRNRKVLQAANWMGATARRVRNALPWR